MSPLRTIPWFTRLLVGLFVAAQFAGMVSAPRADAAPAAAGHHAQVQGHAGHDMPCGHHDDGGNPADTCCALHACFAGLLPPVIAITADAVAGEALAAGPDDPAPGTPGDRLDRPPRLLR